MSEPIPARPGGAEQPLELRASDAEREQVVDLLGHAAAEGRLSVEELEDRLQAVYATRTRGELERLVADVRVEPLADWRGDAKRAGLDRVDVREGPGGSGWIVSIMGGNERRGRWRIAERCTVLNIMGGTELDLNDVELSSRVTQLNCYSLMGGGEIRVPDGVHVEVSKFAFMGGHEVRLGDERPPPGAPLIRIRLVSIMGGCEVRRGRRRRDRGRAAELHRSDTRGELDGGA